MSSVVRMQGVTKRFGSREVLSATDLTIDAGEVVGVIGPNGGGKSTLLMLMAGLLEPTTGTVTVCDKPAQRLALEAAGKVGLVMARPGLYPLLTGWENLDYFAGLFGLTPAETRSKAQPLLDRFALAGSMDSRLSTWSTGMQQKLSLVRALLLSPELLLFDEPAANLDPIAAKALYEELRHRADDGMACVVVTHDLVAAHAVSDRCLLVNGGIQREIETSAQPHVPTGPLYDAWKEMNA